MKVEGVELTREWQRYSVPLKKLDLSSIKTGFVVTLVGRMDARDAKLDEKVDKLQRRVEVLEEKVG